MRGSVATIIAAALVLAVSFEALAGREALDVSFARGKWNADDFTVVKGPRWDYMHGFEQLDDCIVNPCPDLPGEEVYKKHHDEVYAALMHKRRFPFGSEISSRMSFDYRMAPIIVIAPAIGTAADGRPEFREHWEVCLYDEGINVWHHFHDGEKPSWQCAAAIHFRDEMRFKPNVKHEVRVRLSKVDRGGRQMEVTCGDYDLRYVDDSLPDEFCVGVQGCEGRNFFYDLKVKTPEAKDFRGAAGFGLGFAPYTFYKYGLDDMLAAVRKLGVKSMGVKYYMVKDEPEGNLPPERVRAFTDEEIAAFKAKLAKAGIRASSVGPVYMETKEECDAAFAFAERMGVRTLVAVPYRFTDAAKEHRVANRELCEYASTLCAKSGIRYAIHNHGPDSPDYFPTGASAYEMVKDLDPRMGLCLDIGHDFRAGLDPADSIRRYADRLFDVHLKNVLPDAEGKRNRAERFAAGAIDLVRVARALKGIRYRGALEIEYERDFDDNFAALAENVAYFNGILDSLR